ncbi:MAG: metal ABC transporter permease [Deltaproteobacteria bacterium]|nr:metal ABC transporter permease [Deltaproteobacteria bacterium]
MIANFLASWPLFHNAYLSGWLIGILLSLIGVLVVARDQIFIGAAVSQAATMGIAIGMVIGSLLTHDENSWVRSHIFHGIMGGLLAILAALFTARGSKAAGRESHEAVTGWVFLLSVSCSVLLLAHSPHGLEEVNHILSSTIVGATAMDVWLFSALILLTAGALAWWYQPALLVVLDPEMARAVGVPVGRWDALLSIWLGVAIGFSIHVSGVVYAFACLVLPALIAKNLGREIRTMFFLAPLVSFAAGLVSFVLANHYDFPPGQMATANLCLLLAIAWFVHYARLSLPRREQLP